MATMHNKYSHVLREPLNVSTNSSGAASSATCHARNRQRVCSKPSETNPSVT